MSDFDPSKHLRQLRGKGGTADYLDVKWRLVWLRAEHPDATTSTEHVEISPDIAIFRATVTIPSGGSATDYGSETPKDFADYIEKASTKALGRALAQLGYGTQFVGEELDEGVRIVDSPVDRPQNARTPRPAAPAPPVAPARPAAAPSAAAGIPSAAEGLQRATERQVKFIWAIGQEAGMDAAAVNFWALERYSAEVDQLNRRDAADFVEALQRKRNEPTPVEPPGAFVGAYTKEEYEAVIAEAWKMRRTDEYRVVVAFMLTHRARFTPDQLEDSRTEMRLIERATPVAPEEEAAAS